MLKRLVLIFLLICAPAGTTLVDAQDNYVTHTALNGRLAVDIPADWHFLERPEQIVAVSPSKSALDIFANADIDNINVEAPILVFGVERLREFFPSVDSRDQSLRQVMQDRVSDNPDAKILKGIKDDGQSVIISFHSATDTETELGFWLAEGNTLVFGGIAIEADDALLEEAIFDIFRSLQYHAPEISGEIVWQVPLQQPAPIDIAISSRGSLLVGDKNKSNVISDESKVMEYTTSGQLIGSLDYDLSYLSVFDDQVAGANNTPDDTLRAFLSGFSLSGEPIFSSEVERLALIRGVEHDDQGNIWVFFITSALNRDLVAVKFDATGQETDRFILSDHIDEPIISPSYVTYKFAIIGDRLLVTMDYDTYWFSTDGELIEADYLHYQKLYSERVTALTHFDNVIFLATQADLIIRYDLANDVIIESHFLTDSIDSEGIIALEALSEHEVVGILENFQTGERQLFRYNFETSSDEFGEARKSWKKPG